MIMLMLVSSLPKALVATQVNKAVSVRSVLLIDKLDMTPLGKISSRIVNRGSDFESKRMLFMFHKIPIGFSPLASH